MVKVEGYTLPAQSTCYLEIYFSRLTNNSSVVVVNYKANLSVFWHILFSERREQWMKDAQMDETLYTNKIFQQFNNSLCGLYSDFFGANK